MAKFLIITDSIGNPRPFPAEDATGLEETFPYLLREHYPHDLFWQLSFGNQTSEALIDQAISYLPHWKPDYIIVESGITDARPEAFGDVQKVMIDRMSGPWIAKTRQLMYHPSLIKTRQVARVNLSSFRKTARKLKLVFDTSKVMWLEICALDGYERARPGVGKRLVEYNSVLKEVYQDDFISLKESLIQVDGFNADYFHWNKAGHQAVAKILIQHIEKKHAKK